MKKNNMKKTGKIARSCFAALLAVVMAVPVAAISNLGVAPVNETVEAEAADVDIPEPIMTLDFERGFKGEKEDGLKVKESKERLMFEEYTNENGNYVKDPDTGEYIFKWTDVPVIFGTDDDPVYQKGTFGNQPTTYDDEVKGNVIRLDDSMEAEWIIKTVSDKADKVVPVYTGGFDETTGEPLDKEAAEKSTLQIAHTAHSAVQINNPFAGKDFTEEYDNTTEEGPQWTKGVTISYWVKVPTKELAEGEELEEGTYANDSVLFTFENIQRPEGVDQYTALDPDGEKVVYEVNGYIKHKAAAEYDPEDPMYAQGELYTLTDIQTKETFEVLKDYGPLVRLTPEYPGTPDRKIYFRDDSDEKTPDKTVNVVEGGKQVKAKLYELGANIYNDYKSLKTTEGSLVARGYINGSMQISASNSFHFKEDDYFQKVELDEAGNDVTIPIKGAYDINPNNKEEIGEFRQFRYYNTFYFQGDGTVTEEADEWHYVTCVIQNDWVQFYVDGEEIDADSLGYHGTPFNSLNGKKYFNKGYGIRYPYHIGWTNVAEWIDDGTFTSGPSNCEAQTMLEWISNPDTVLYIGYEGVCAESLEQDMGTLDGTMLDDITFYDVPLTAEQATVLYEQANAEMNGTDDIKPFKVFDFESDEVDKLPAGFTELSTNNHEDTRTPKVVSDKEYGNVFKFGEGKSTKTSAVSFENPFKGMNELEGATVSYWVKTYANEKGKIGDGVVFSVIDEPKVLEHSKIQEAVKDVESRTALFSMLSYDAEFMAAVDTQVYATLKNNFKQSTKKSGNTKPGEAGYDEEADRLEDEWNARLTSLTEWHHVTMVIENSGITMYMDGVKHSNNQIDQYGSPSVAGPRFYDGYYNKMFDNFSHIRLGTGNQTATSVMEFLTQEDTTAYFGFVYTLGKDTTYRASGLTLLDDVSFYDKALTEAEVATVYSDAVAAAEAKKGGSGYVPYPEEGGDTPSDAPEPSLPPTDIKEESGFTKTADGKLTATANGVTVTGDESSIPANAKLVVNKLGVVSSKDKYTAASAALKKAGITVDSYTNTLYDIHLEVDGKEVAPTGKLTITLTPPTGYQAAKTTVVRMSDVKSMTTSVSGSSLVYETESLGEFAVMQKKSVSGNVGATGSSTAGKTGDTASVVVPVMLLAVAFVVVAALRKKEELMED